MTTTPESTVTTEFTPPDVYGQSHPIETPELIECRLAELDAALQSVDKDSAYSQALQQCPDLVNDRDVRLQFLRARKFNAASAAERMVRYWEQRLLIFSPTRAFLPMTRAGALRDDTATLDRGVIIPTGQHDPEGRAIVCFFPSRCDPKAYERESLARVFWYMLHTVLDASESAQQKGLVMVNCTKGVQLSQFDRGLVRLMAPSISGALPIRLTAMHICYPPTFFSVVFPVIAIFLGPKLRKRVQVHGKDVVEKLASVNLSAAVLPTEVGGTLELDLKGWLEKRLAKEVDGS